MINQYPESTDLESMRALAIRGSKVTPGKAYLVEFSGKRHGIFYESLGGIDRRIMALGAGRVIEAFDRGKAVQP